MRACKDAHEWEDCKSIDGRNLASRNKTFFELFANKSSFVCLDLHDNFLVSHGFFETKEQSSPLVKPDKIK